jgi:hypothetical protein
MRKIRAQLQAVIAVYLAQDAASSDGTASVANDKISADSGSVDSDVELASGVGLASDSDEDETNDEDDNDIDEPLEHALADIESTLDEEALQCFIDLGGVRETCVWLTGVKQRQTYFLYVPPGGGRKLRSLTEVRQYLDTLPSVDEHAPAFSKTLGETDLQVDGKRKRTSSVLLVDPETARTNQIAAEERRVAMEAAKDEAARCALGPQKAKAATSQALTASKASKASKSRSTSNDVPKAKAAKATKRKQK